MLDDERQLLSAAVALGAADVGPVSSAEQRLLEELPTFEPARVQAFRKAITQGEDPLGDAFCQLRSPSQRRPFGATYTPRAVVDAMLQLSGPRVPARVVDPGAGTGRFLVAAGLRFPRAELLACELDPVACFLLRAHLASAGLAKRARVVLSDYRELTLGFSAGPTLFIGNPPYVRHQLIEPRWKRWLVEQARALGLAARQRSGLHVHFFLATARQAQAGDYGAFITSSEWLDVNYGALLRKLFLGQLGGQSLHVLEPQARLFADAETTSAIACFEVGSRPSEVRVAHVASLAALNDREAGRAVPREQLAAAPRWSVLTRPSHQRRPGFVELGELCRVHRGQVTGKNNVWIQRVADGELPQRVLFPSVTKARELFAAGPVLSDTSALKRVIDLPADLDCLTADERAAIERFLQRARAQGADRGFIANHRKRWWSVGLREPAPILATYMARRSPAFVRNLAGARHINIAHGLYPRQPLSAQALDALARHLTAHTELAQGRTYAGGLTKFEPKEMERLLVPAPRELEHLG
jgi:methylase of polypeptide subunit release factors